jgi:hypothetical protein
MVTGPFCLRSTTGSWNTQQRDNKAYGKQHCLLPPCTPWRSGRLGQAKARCDSAIYQDGRQSLVSEDSPLLVCRRPINCRHAADCRCTTSGRQVHWRSRLRTTQAWRRPKFFEKFQCHQTRSTFQIQRRGERGTSYALSRRRRADRNRAGRRDRRSRLAIRLWRTSELVWAKTRVEQRMTTRALNNKAGRCFLRVMCSSSEDDVF